MDVCEHTHPEGAHTHHIEFDDCDQMDHLDGDVPVITETDHVFYGCTPAGQTHLLRQAQAKLAERIVELQQAVYHISVHVKPPCRRKHVRVTKHAK